METLSVHQRWMALPWGGFGVALALVFGGIGVQSLLYSEDERSVRVVIPMYALAVYWVVALLCNWRTATITPRGVRVSIGPFPIRPSRRVRHDQIRHCFLRRVDIADDAR